MKSPNVYTTSLTQATPSSLRQTYAAFALTALVCLLACCACRSADSAFGSRKSSDNPYAKYDPKTPEEEAYYRDVYSGDWHEDTMAGEPSVCKQSASTQMPEHWTMLPPGAKTMSEIRAESSQRKLSSAMSTRASYQPNASTVGGYQVASTQGAYAAQSAPTANAYAPQASAPTSYAPQASAPTSYAPQAPTAPSSYAPQGATPASAAYQGASVDLFNSQSRIVRGQAPDDDPFADDAEEDPFGDLEEDSEEEEVEVIEEEEKKDAAVEKSETKAEESVEATKVEPQPVKSAVEMKEENVNAKNVAANASVVPAGRPGAVPVQPVVVDPSIAAPFAKVNRPINETPETEGANVKRAEQDEYVVTGGDAKGEFYSRKDWSYENLDPEDSVAHFDTVDGRILVEPSNKLFIYSPRFGAVRQTIGPIEGDHRLALETAIATQEPTSNDSAAGVDVREQEVKPLGANSIQNVEGAEASASPAISTGALGALEADAQIRLGALLTAETIDDLSSEDSSLVFDGAVAAQSWDGEQGVAVSTELVNVFSNAYVEGAATIFSIKDDTKTSKLRVIKIANKDAAKPGEFVEFTLRFENIGDETIGNVTILDNLSSRLRYVDGTAKSSVQADFSANLSESGSLVLRWEITAPLEPKEFGVARFICKVR